MSPVSTSAARKVPFRAAYRDLGQGIGGVASVVLVLAQTLLVLVVGVHTASAQQPEPLPVDVEPMPAGSPAAGDEPGTLGGVDPLDPNAPLATDGAASTITKEYLDDVVLRLARDGNKEGLRLMAASDYPAALAAFSEAHQLEPENAQIAGNLAAAYHQLGNRLRAQVFYRLTLELDRAHPTAHVGLADLLAASSVPSHLEEARELLVRARELVGNDAGVILRQARVAAASADLVAAERHYSDAARLLDSQGEALQQSVLPPTLTSDLRIEIADYYRDNGSSDDALLWYRKAQQAGVSDAQARIRDLEVEDQARRFGWARPKVDVPERARGMTARARGLIAAAKDQDAEPLLLEVLRSVPGYTAARVLLGELHRRSGDRAAAELTYLRGLAHDQGDLELHVRLAQLYMASEGRASEAVMLLERAVQLAPSRPELRLSLVKAHRQNGDLAKAREAVDAYLAANPPVDGRLEATLIRTALVTLLEPVDGGTDLQPEPPLHGVRLAALNRIRVLLARGETERGMAELQALRSAGHQGSAALINLEARILQAVGRSSPAAERFRASLAIDPEQPRVRCELGLLHLALGEPGLARAELLRSEFGGSAVAGFHLARLTYADFPDAPWQTLPALVAARRRVARFLIAEPDSPFASDALGLRRNLDTALMQHGGSLGLAAIGLVLLVWIAYRRRFGGSDLATLVTTHPETVLEVQRILSAVRHEVLKHNAVVLSGLVDAMERGEDRRAVRDMAVHACRSLLGDRGSKTRPQSPGVVARLEQYVMRLERVGRAHRFRLNLRRRDKGIAAIFEGFERLATLRRDLEQYDPARGWRSRALLAATRRAARLLNVDGRGAIEDLLDRLRAVPIDEHLLRSVFARTCAEPALASANLAPLQLSADTRLPCGIAMPKDAFEDVLGNLVRNAIQSSIAYPPADQAGEPVAIGLSVAAEMNPITGHQRVIFGVRDRSQQPLSVAQLRGQGVEGGLGLAVRLVARYEGSLDLRNDLADWSKEVLVKLPREELGSTGGRQ